MELLHLVQHFNQGVGPATLAANHFADAFAVVEPGGLPKRGRP
jgi:hypothetical protein